MYQEKSFDLPQEFQGKLSRTSVDEHLKLYSGYVKHTNYILEQIAKLRQADAEANKYEIGELRRRLGFEFDGMRNHEYYFSSLENGPSELTQDGPLAKQIEQQWGSVEDWLSEFKQLATIRGVGWAVLYYDPQAGRLINAWIDEQQLGHLTGLQPVLMLDMWEHSFVYDYQPSGKGQYVEDFFANLNWSVIESGYIKAKK